MTSICLTVSLCKQCFSVQQFLKLRVDFNYFKVHYFIVNSLFILPKTWVVMTSLLKNTLRTVLHCCSWSNSYSVMIPTLIKINKFEKYIYFLSRRGHLRINLAILSLNKWLQASYDFFIIYTIYIFNSYAKGFDGECVIPYAYLR